MSIYYSGALKRSAGLMSAITKQMKTINLKGVKRIAITFDPFDTQCSSTREFLFLLSTPKVVKTNPNCVLKTDIVCNRRKPEVRFSLIDSAKEQAKVKEIRFVSDNLSVLELLQLCNKHVSTLAPAEDISAKATTKSEKQKLGGGSSRTTKRK